MKVFILDGCDVEGFRPIRSEDIWIPTDLYSFLQKEIKQFDVGFFHIGNLNALSGSGNQETWKLSGLLDKLKLVKPLDSCWILYNKEQSCLVALELFEQRVFSTKEINNIYNLIKQGKLKTADGLREFLINHSSTTG